jgi:hypothetical protein
MTPRIHATFVALCAVASAAATPAWAGRIKLNDTGMTQCIDHQKQWSSDCAKSRQDAAYGRDAEDANPDDGVAGFSFRKVCRSGQMAGEGTCPADPALGSGPDEWGCTYDNVSQLTWEVKTADGGVHDYLRRFSNKGGKARDASSDAAWLKDVTNAEALCGATDWRLPDAIELQSIVYYGMGTSNFTGPFIDPSFFPYDAKLFTWTRDGVFNDPKWAWYIYFDNGRISFEQRFASLASARLVHGASGSFSKNQAAIAKDRFVPSADGTEVRDTLTGLAWRRCAAGMVWNNNAQSCDGEATRFTWNLALDYAKANREGGWRLPNAKELFSLVDPDTESPAIDHLAFPNTPISAIFISSTPLYGSETTSIHGVAFYRGSLEHLGAWDNSWFIRLVGGGRD